MVEIAKEELATIVVRTVAISVVDVVLVTAEE